MKINVLIQHLVAYESRDHTKPHGTTNVAGSVSKIHNTDM